MQTFSLTLPDAYTSANGKSYPCEIAATLFPAHGPHRGDVIAVHGLTRQKRDFDFIAPHLAAAGYTVICPDMPGRGDSSRLRDGDDYALPSYAGIMARFLDARGLNKTHWIGSSMGGLIAMEMAAQGHAGRFRSLTLVDITHKPNPAACARIADYVTAVMPLYPDIESYAAVLKQNLVLGTVPDNIWMHYAAHQLRRNGDYWTLHYDPNMVPMVQKALRAPIDLSAGMEKITCPVALVAGEISDLCTPAEAAGLKRMKPDLKIHVCPGSGHVPPLCDAESRAFILGFLEAAL